MEEKFWLCVSIVCSIFGLILLFFISQKIELKQTEINQITPDDIGKNVKVCGNITSRYISKNNHLFLLLKDDTGEINIVVFNNTAKSIEVYELEKGNIVCVTGVVSEYKNKLEIILEKIERR